ncbi:zinc finger: C2H2 type-like protein [Leptotrombidium deliense]|uniref:Zinc finger: C2H2 type-like protein n=1 Tax=Leptotrombidium deliense TaxID=299467 RepID=A0A443SKD4_9ACAR|nr:zinc finger: C2H2 type-like protein [Leptotrombidium deliense]
MERSNERTQSVIIFGKRSHENSQAETPSRKKCRIRDEYVPLTPQTPVICDENRQQNNRRGRPKLEAITSLIISGTVSPSPIRCNVCSRVFPREKSLQAHLRTHTGERPYICDFPGCSRKFTQSGQLRTHQRLHTGEKPFVCAFKGCKNRFTHANRHCSLHPGYGVKRDKSENISAVLKVNTSIENMNEEIARWLERHSKISRRESSKRSLRSRKLNQELEAAQAEDNDSIDCFASVWKKKRATLKQTTLNNVNSLNVNVNLGTSILNDNYVTNDKLMGALALIELAASSPLTANPPVDIGSEIDVHDESTDQDVRFGIIFPNNEHNLNECF